MNYNLSNITLELSPAVIGTLPFIMGGSTEKSILVNGVVKIGDKVFASYHGNFPLSNEEMLTSLNNLDVLAIKKVQTELGIIL